MAYKPLTKHNLMEMWLFDTCNFRCGYCSLVPSGDVTRTDQLDCFRSLEFIDGLIEFFRSHRPAGRPWAVLLTGGEATLMPNLDAFVLGLGRMGDTVAIYTNMSVSLEKVLSDEAFSYLSYIEASFHPDWHMGKFNANTFYTNVKALKERDVPVLVRFVGDPKILDLLPEIAKRCDEIGVSFFPTTLFNPLYPASYTESERAELSSYMLGYSSLIQLDGGLVTDGHKCIAADRVFATRLHKGGDITPCISTDSPVLGNIFENTLRPIPGWKNCFRKDAVCSCDIHFQQHVVERVDDSEEFSKILSNQGVHRVTQYQDWKSRNAISTTNKTWVGQGLVTNEKNDLLRPAPKMNKKSTAHPDNVDAEKVDQTQES